MKNFTSRLLNSGLCFLVVVSSPLASTAQSPVTGRSAWAQLDGQNRLIYKTTSAGDKIMDFSHAGYRGGGVRLPDVAVAVTVRAVDGDNTAAIQAAIDAVSRMPLRNGFRGTVLLQPGVYSCDRAINISASGVVLRGSGPGEDGTVINMTGKTHTCITVRGSVTTTPVGAPTTIWDAYVPSGSYSFTVADARGLAVEDTIQMTRPVTAAWIAFMGMDSLVRDGKKQTWLSGDITASYVIRKLDGNKVTLTVPLTDNFDARHTAPEGVRVVKVRTAGVLSGVGIEYLRIVSPAQGGTISEGHHKAFTMSGVEDAWARNIDVFNTVNSISVTGKRITVDQVRIIHDQPTEGAAKPADLNGSGQQLLFNKCYIRGDNLFFFGTGAKVTGPVALLNCTFEGNGWIQPHQRWATGLLVDGCAVPNGGIDFMNRGIMGSGHGWAIGWAVAWNATAKTFLNQQPPGSLNWVIGGTGEKQQRAIPFNTEPNLPEGIYDAHGTPVSPRSLYLQQLEERLGKRAVKNIGY